MRRYLLWGAALTLLTACELPMTAQLNNPNDAKAPGYTGGGPTTKAIEVAFATVQPGNIVAFQIDPATGLLTGIPGSPITGFSSIGTSSSIVLSPFNGRTLIALDHSLMKLHSYLVTPETGVVTEQSGSPFALTGGGIAGPPVFTNDGKHVYVLHGTTYEVFSVDTLTGAVTFTNSYSHTATSPGEMVISPVGNVAFISETIGAAGLKSFLIGTSSGILTQVSGLSLGSAGTRHIAVNATGTRVSLVDAATGNQINATVDPVTGVLSTVANPATPAAASLVAFDPSGSFLYIVDPSMAPTKIHGSKFQGGTYATIAGSPTGLNYVPVSMAFNKSGNLLYTDDNIGNMQGFAVDASTGVLSAGSPFATWATNFAIDPSGNWGVGFMSGNMKTFHAVGASTLSPIDTKTAAIFQGNGTVVVGIVK
jgi:hypothetical protein